MIEKGTNVNVHYTGRLTNGEVFDSSDGKEPLNFTVGSGQIIPGFENAIIGKNIGDKVTVNIKPEDAYGEVREDLFIKVPNDQLPGVVEVGTQLQAQADNGSPILVTVEEVNEDHVIINGNHQLSGQELEFDIEIVGIN
jgi:FKBP-type peptidyl-prolyl cis-trans isomerase 2